MKPLTALLLPLLLCGCDTLQSRGEAAAGIVMQQDLYDPSSYRPVSTRVDSARVDIHYHMDALATAKRIYRLQQQQSAVSGEENLRVYRSSISRLEEQIRAIDRTLDKGTFAGWALRHKYRAANSTGTMLDDEVLIFMDSEMRQCRGILSLTGEQGEELPRLRRIIDRALQHPARE